MKDTDKPKEAVVKPEYKIDDEDEDDVNQLVKIHVSMQALLLR